MVKLEDVVEECDNLAIHIELIPAELLQPVGDVPSLCIGAADSSRETDEEVGLCGWTPTQLRRRLVGHACAACLE